MWRWPCKNIHSWIPKNHSNNLNERIKEEGKRKKTWKKTKSIHTKTIKLKLQNERKKIELDRMFMFHWMWSLGVPYGKKHYVVVCVYIIYLCTEAKIRKWKTKQNKIQYSKWKKKQNKREAEAKEMKKKKKLMMTIMSVKSECRTHTNVWCALTYVRMYTYSISMCGVVAVLFNICELMTFSLSLFFRGIIVYVARLFIAAKHYKRHTHARTQISQSRNEFVFFRQSLSKKQRID